MASGSIKECGICSYDFDEDERCPRILPCSHCFCTICIQQIIDKDDKKCPFCRQIFKANSARELIINRNFLDILQYVKDLEAHVRYQTLPKTNHDMKRDSKLLHCKNIQSCHLTGEQMEKAIRSNYELKQKMSKNHHEMKGDILSTIKNLDKKHEAKVNFIDEVNENLKRYLEEVRGCQKHLYNVKENLDEATEPQRIDSAVQEVEISNAAFQIWSETFNIMISHQEKVHQKIRQNVNYVEEKISVFKETLSSLEKEETTLNNLWISQEHSLGEMTPEAKEKLSKALRYLARSGRAFAVKEYEGKKMIAKLSINDDDRILLHCLREGNLPSNAYTVNHRVLLKLVDRSSWLTFVDLGTGFSSFGRLFIRHPENPNARHFTMSCTGERGVSWVGTALNEIVNRVKPDEYVFSFHERNNSLIGLQNSWKNVIERKNSGGLGRGLVTCHNGASRFSITTRDNTKAVTVNECGMVESNLNVLTDAISRNPRPKFIKIMDCGIVLSEPPDTISVKKSGVMSSF